MDRNALVLGGSGLVGGKITEALVASGYSVSFTYFGNKAEILGAEGVVLDISDGSALEKLVGRLRPALIVNTVALPSVDQCEKDPERAYKVNSEPQRIIAESAESDSSIAFISTSNVFGPSKRALSEEDETGPISTYGKTKLVGENYTKKFANHIILRSDQIYGWTLPRQKKTFVERTLEKLEKGESVEVCRDWFNCPTYADDIAASLLSLAGKGRRGVYHAVGPTYIDRYEWGLKIANSFGHDGRLVRPIDSSSLGLPAKRSNCHLSNEKIQRESGVSFLSVDDGLERMAESRNTPRP